MPTIDAASNSKGYQPADRRTTPARRRASRAMLLALAGLAITSVLGCASKDRAQASNADSSPTALGATSSNAIPRDPIRVLKELDDRRLKLTANARQFSDGGDVFFVCLFGPDGISPVQVLEHVTNRPLRARIESQSLIFPSARLTGEKPPELSLRGAILLAHPPLATLTNTSQVTVDDPMLRTDHPPPTG